jgi:CelD/BcsL family acetyltransferase involved in cellulose biosynthesis
LKKATSPTLIASTHRNLPAQVIAAQVIAAEIVVRAAEAAQAVVEAADAVVVAATVVAEAVVATEDTAVVAEVATKKFVANLKGRDQVAAFLLEKESNHARSPCTKSSSNASIIQTRFAVSKRVSSNSYTSAE